MSKPPIDADLQAYFDRLDNIPDPPERGRTLTIELDPFNASVSCFRCGPGVLRLYELPRPLSKRLTFVAKRLLANGVRLLEYTDGPQGEQTMCEALPEDVRQIASGAIEAFRDTAWYVSYQCARENAAGRMYWHCPDCRTEVPLKIRQCKAEGCPGEEFFARCMGQTVVATALPTAKTAGKR